ncbi:MAG: 4Fe-4S binding protein [Saprospiraceae bacterium]|nr:4Fe-4S binding protein [Saprospiraceae bacterium]
MSTPISMSLVQRGHDIKIHQKIAVGFVVIALIIQCIYWFSQASQNASAWLWISILLASIGSIGYTITTYKQEVKGIKNNNNWFSSLTSRGALAWGLAVFLTGFYIILYWYPALLGLSENGISNTGLIKLFDPLSMTLKGSSASQWFVYGTLYTLIILLMGIKFIYKYRHNRYQIIRTLSVMFFQTAIAFILPEILQSLNQPYNDFKNIWPLNYSFFLDWHIDELIKNGLFGYFILFWGIISFLVITPILTYFYGKRWYCSWVCGCGGLAETAGDPFRHLSNKSLIAWKIERWMIHGVLVFVSIMTVAALVTRSTGFSNLFFFSSYDLSKWYGFLIGSVFSGVIGVGFYPLMGSRVWCRFGCPMAAYLGLWQKKKSKFRITTNGGQCISCGNCSTYCEMGIDVKAYAQQGQDIVRSSCVGCGICSAVCPRGVLRLENGSLDIDIRAEEKRTLHIN